MREKRRRPARAAAAGFLLALAGVAGCTHSQDRTSFLEADSRHTASIAPLSADAEVLSDEKAIAPLLAGSSQAAPLAWSNPETGSTGVISHIAEVKNGPATCRAFRTTRHAFDGIAAFEGRACRMPDGAWRVQAFDRIAE